MRNEEVSKVRKQTLYNSAEYFNHHLLRRESFCLSRKRDTSKLFSATKPSYVRIFPGQRDKQTPLTTLGHKRAVSNPSRIAVHILFIRQTTKESDRSEPKLDFSYRFHPRKIRYSTEGARSAALSTSNAGPTSSSSASSSWLSARRGVAAPAL